MIELESYANDMYQGRMEKILLKHVKGTLNEKYVKKLIEYKHKSNPHGFYYLERMSGISTSFNRVFVCDIDNIECIGYLSDFSEKDAIILKAAQYKKVFDAYGDMFLKEDVYFDNFVELLEKLSDKFAGLKDKPLEEAIKTFASTFTLEEYKSMLEDKKLEKYFGKDLMHLAFRWTEDDSPKIDQWAHNYYYKKCWKHFKRWQRKVLFNYSMYANKKLSDWAYFEYSNKEQRRKELLGDVFGSIKTATKIFYRSHIAPEDDSIGYIDGPWFFAYKARDTILSMLAYTVLFGHVCDDGRLDQVLSMDEALTKLKKATDLEDLEWKTDEEVANKIKKKHGVDIASYFTEEASLKKVWLIRKKLAKGEAPTGFVKGSSPYEMSVPRLEDGWQYFDVSEDLLKEINELENEVEKKKMATLPKEIRRAYKLAYAYIGENSLEWSD